MPAFTTTFLESQPLAEGTRAFRFARPEGFAFRAGQSANFTLVDPPRTDAKGNMRTFSIASAPSADHLEIATRMRDSAFKGVLAGLAPGSPVKLRGPGGQFTLPEDATRPIAMIAGGIGITPFMSMLRHARDSGAAPPITLVYSNRRPEDAAYLAELTALESRVRRFRLVATMTDMERSSEPWDGERAMVDGAFVARHVNAAERPLYYLAGPPAMVAALRKTLTEAGVPGASLVSDEFFGY